MTKTDKLWIIGAMTGACLFGLLVGRWTATPVVAAGRDAPGEIKMVNAHQFNLIDGKGQVVGLWTAHEGSPVFALLDKGKPRLSVAIADGVSQFAVLTENGKVRTALTESDNGWAGVYTQDSSGRQRASIGSMNDGTTVWSMKHPASKDTFGVVQMKEGDTRAEITNAAGQTVWSVP